jgi:hypothetical protein
MAARANTMRTPGARRTRAGLRAVLLVLAAAALLAVLPAAASAAVDDWRHEWEVLRLVTYLQGQDPAPRGPMIYDLGDSIARESITSDSIWTTQLTNRARRADKVVPRAYTLAGHNQTFGMDEQLVAGIPATPAGQPPGIVLIGVGISRFIGPPLEAARIDLDPPAPGVAPALSPWERHVYDGRKPLSLARKKELVPRWMERRWAAFKANRDENFEMITRIIKLCKAKGLRPVLIDQPLDMKIVGSGLDRPRLSIRSGCDTLVKRYRASHGVRYLHFTKAVGIPSKYYWDMHHLFAPGARLWQARLSDELVKLLPPAGTL